MTKHGITKFIRGRNRLLWGRIQTANESLCLSCRASVYIWPVTTAEVLVHAFINSKLDFCNSLLHSFDGFPKYEINKLQSVQNVAARVIACLSKFDHINDTLMQLPWLPVEQRIIFKINLICFKILNNSAPDYLVDLIHVYEPARYLRSSSDKWRLVIKPYSLKTYGFRAFSFIRGCQHQQRVR